MPILRRAAWALALCATAAGAQQEPPRRLELGSAVEEVVDTTPREGTTSREVRNAFVRNQLLLGAVSYGPGFAVMLGTEPATRIAGWMVMTGASFFAANELAGQFEITPARQVLSSRMGLRGSASGLALGDAWRLPEGERGALVLIGGLSGTTLGMVMGRGLSEGEAVAAVVGHDIVAATAYGLSYVTNPGDGDGDLRSSVRIAIPLALGWGGYALGRVWARRATYGITAGDASLLWLGAGIGAVGATTVIIESEPEVQTVAGTLVLGGLAGAWAANRYLVRRFDHSRGEAALVSGGAVAGSLMGIGLGVLVSGDAVRNSAPTFAFAAMGAIGGVWVTERYAQASADQGQKNAVGSSRLQVNPLGAVAALSGAPGMHSLVRFTF